MAGFVNFHKGGCKGLGVCSTRSSDEVSFSELVYIHRLRLGCCYLVLRSE